jgi:hypothetical protein
MKIKTNTFQRVKGALPAAQARQSIYAIKSYQRNFGKFLHSDYLKLFDSMVKSILTYSAEIYGSEISEILEQV